MRSTHATLRVALALLDGSGATHYGYDLGRRAKVRSGTLYPILGRMLDEGWLADGWENPAATPGRPPRRYYTITPKGLAALGELRARGSDNYQRRTR